MKSKSNIGKIIISLPICIGLALFISANILNTTVKNHYIKIYGLYGNNIAIADIEELSLKDTIPTINKRVNGIMLTNGKKKGYFNLDGKSPFIYIKTPKDQYYINLITADETKTFYNEIMKEKS